MNKWKEASSLIISAVLRNQVSQKTQSLSKLAEVEKCNHEILTLKKKGSPRICVFPGGHFSPADSAQEWETLFLSFGMSIASLSNSLHAENVSKLSICDCKGEGIPRWLSMRITAIRETFEESGILLCKDKLKSSSPGQEGVTNLSHHFDINDIETWRAKVLSDPYEFLTLCKVSKCYPDVENLTLWSNWLTPSYMPNRFDVLFFHTCMDTSKGLVQVSPDFKEISTAQWHSPEELLKLSKNGDIWLLPPQWYEINKLSKLGEFTSLLKYSSQIENNSDYQRWMPVRIVAANGEISLLPGDKMYPKEVNLFDPSPVYREDEPMESLRCDKMHRMEHIAVSTSLLDTRWTPSGRNSDFNNNSHYDSKL